MELINIATDLAQTDNYREVIFTGQLQLVYMTLEPEEIIPMEVHPDTDQLVRVEAGLAQVKVYITGARNSYEDRVAHPGDLIIIPAGTHHEFLNSGEGLLQLTVIYSNPLHPKDEIQKYPGEEMED